MAFETILLPGLVIGLTLTAVVWVVIKILPEKSHPKGSAPIGTMVSGLILVYAFVLGLTISQETSALAAASAATSTEANSVGELYWYAHVLSQPEHSKLQADLVDYASLVVHKEFPVLGNHQSSPEAAAAVRAIRFDILSFQPSTPSEKAVYGNMLSEVGNLFKARRNRNDIAVNGGVPSILIESISFLTVIIVLLIPVTGKVRKFGELAIFGLFTTFLMASLFFIADLNNPFKGNVQVHPTAFNILFTGTFKNVP